MKWLKLSIPIVILDKTSDNGHIFLFMLFNKDTFIPRNVTDMSTVGTRYHIRDSLKILHT